MFVQTKAEYFDLLAPIMAGNGEPRFYLQGVAIQPHPVAGVYVVASDGHRIGVFHDENGVFQGAQDTTLILPVPTELRQAARPRKSDVRDRLLTFDDGRASVTLYDDAAESEHVYWSADLSPIDGKFPEWLRVFPRNVPGDGAVDSVNPHYLADFCRIAKSSGKYPEIRCYHGPPDRAMVVLTARDDFAGLIMPMRSAAILDDVPEWLHVNPTAAAAGEN